MKYWERLKGDKVGYCTYAKRIQGGMKRTKAIKRSDRSITYEGITYPGIPTLCEAFGINRDYYYRYRYNFRNLSFDALIDMLRTIIMSKRPKKVIPKKSVYDIATVKLVHGGFAL